MISDHSNQARRILSKTNKQTNKQKKMSDLVEIAIKKFENHPEFLQLWP